MEVPKSALTPIVSPASWAAHADASRRAGEDMAPFDLVYIRAADGLVLRALAGAAGAAGVPAYWAAAPGREGPILAGEQVALHKGGLPVRTVPGLAPMGTPLFLSATVPGGLTTVPTGGASVAMALAETIQLAVLP